MKKSNKQIIKTWRYDREYKELKSKILNNVNKVFSSGQLILGKEVKKFELNFSKFVNCKFGVGVNSGTDAIKIALMSLELKNSAEVITVSNTAVPTVSAIVSANAKPVFVDINESDFLIDLIDLKKKINKKTKAIIVVNLYGQVPNFSEIKKIAKFYKVKVIEDCAQSIGSYSQKKHAGSFGDIGAFSFYPTKNLGAYGDGGMIVTNNKKYYKKCLMLRKYGMKKLYYSELHGVNSRLDEVQASILNFKLKYLKKNNKRRREIANMYDSQIKNPNIILPKQFQGRHHSFHAYVVRHSNREKILKYLKKKDVNCSIIYPFPIHLMKGYKYLGYKKGDLPITEKIIKEIFSLPVYPSLKNKEVKKVINLINKFTG